MTNVKYSFNQLPRALIEAEVDPRGIKSHGMVTVSSHMVGVAILDHNSESLRPPETDNENAESKPFDVIRMGSNIVYLVVSSAVVPGFQAENLNVEPPLELHETEAIKRYIGTK